MNYSIELPEELKGLSIPKFKMKDNELIIMNRPSLWELFVPVVILIFIFFMFMSGNISVKDPYNEDYFLLLINLLVLGLIILLSLNKVCIDFKQKSILIRNYNPLVNLGRKFFKMPFLISFDEIDKFYSDWKLGGRGSMTNYFTVLQTNVPYKFRIALFTNDTQSKIFAEYLNRILNDNRNKI